MKKTRPADLLAGLSFACFLLFALSLSVLYAVDWRLVPWLWFDHAILAVCTLVVPSALMWAWMVVDCVIMIVRGRKRGLFAWLVAMLLFWPGAWAYYVYDKRQRTRGEAASLLGQEGASREMCRPRAVAGYEALAADLLAFACCLAVVTTWAWGLYLLTHL